MADQTINDLTSKNTPALTDMFELDDGASKKTTLAGIGAGLGVVKTNVTTTNPSATDDSSQGFAAKSKWLNTTTGIEYICRDASVGAASWVRQDNADFWGYISGRYYFGGNNILAAGSAITTVGSIRMHPIVIKERVTINELGARVTTIQASGTFQLGIYATDYATMMPTGGVLGATGTLSGAAAGVVTGAITPVTLNPGLYWVGINVSLTGMVFQAFGTASTWVASLIGGTSAQISSGTTGSAPGLSFTVAFGTWPDLTGQTMGYLTSATYAGIFFKVA